jgi:hypothetical protein
VQHVPDVDEVVGDDAEAGPTLHSVEAPVSATIKAMPALDYADTAFGSGPPFLAIAEPALFLLASAFRALGRAIGNTDALRICWRLDAPSPGCVASDVLVLLEIATIGSPP